MTRPRFPRLLAKLDEGYDLVSGWKTKRQDPLTRRIPSKIFNAVAGKVSGVRLHDMNCGLKAYRAEVVEGMQLYGELHRYTPVLAHYRGYRVTELPVNHRPREHGRSNYGVERYVRGFLDLLTVTFMGRYRHRPLHLFGGLGLIAGALGFAILVYLTLVKLTGHAIGQRPLLTLGVLLVVVGIQLLSLGLLSELITSHHEERRRVESQTEFGSGSIPADGRPPLEHAMRVLYFGTYDRSYPRNAQVISALRGAGVEVIEQHRAVWEQRHNWSVGLRQMLRVAEAERSLRHSEADGETADVLIVGYPGHFDLPAAKRVARGRPVVFNPLVSLYDTLVDDRGAFPAWLTRRTGRAPRRPAGLPSSRCRRRGHRGSRPVLP